MGEKIFTKAELVELLKTKKVATSASFFTIPSVLEKLKECDIIFTTNNNAEVSLRGLGLNVFFVWEGGYIMHELNGAHVDFCLVHKLFKESEHDYDNMPRPDWFVTEFEDVENMAKFVE